MIKFIYEDGNERVEDGTEQVFMDKGGVEGMEEGYNGLLQRGVAVHSIEELEQLL